MSSGAASPTVTTFSGTFTLTMSESSSSPRPSATNIQQGDRTNGQSSSFYRNLFYILIGLLVAFGLVSFLSLLRARRRRNAIVREARRLGLMVPGIPGYVSMRDRANMQWTKSDGSQNPDWWEVEAKRDGMDEKVSNAGSGSGSGQDPDAEDAELYPLAIIPHTSEVPPSQTPLPQSSLPFFPNHLAYRPTALQAPPARFNMYQPETIDQLYGEDVDIITVIRMPMREPQREVEEGEEVLREWGGVELGIARMEVVNRRESDRAERAER